MTPSFWKNKRILIVGGTGFIGENFVSILEELGANVCFTSRRTNEKNNSIKADPQNLGDLLRIRKKFDVLINCAALDGNGYFKKQFSAEVCDVNSRIALNIFNFAREKQIKDLVLFSSADIYSDLKKKKIKEIDLRLDKINYQHGYKTSKIILEVLARFCAFNNKDMRIYLPRPSYVYGEGDKYKDENNSRLIPLLIHNIKNEKKITFYGGKSKKINLIYVRDLVDSVLAIVENKKTGAMNVTSSELLTVFKIVEGISNEIGKKAKINFEQSNYRSGFLMNNERLLKIKADFTPFKKGIINTIKKIF